MATIKLAEEFQNWANQFVDMSEAFYDLPMLDDEEVEKIAEAFCDKNGNMNQHDWEKFAEDIQGALSEKIFNYFRRGGVHDEHSLHLQMSPIDLDLSAEENLQKTIVELSQQGFSVGEEDLNAMRQAIVEAMNSFEAEKDED